MSAMPANMHAVYLTGHGGFDKLSYVSDAPMPQAGTGEVLIRVGAAGINNTDINTRIGWYSKTGTTQQGSEQGLDEADADDGGWGGAIQFPRIQGADVCGRIIAVGDGVSSDRVGKRVLVEPCFRQGEADFSYFGSEHDGGFAQYTKAPARFCHRVECDWSDAELATIPCSYSTAENLLTRAGVGDSDTVLVTGASGGVGSAAVQLAKRRGVRVLAIAGASKAADVLALGADEVIPRGTDLLEVLGENSVDVVVDLVAGEQWPMLLQVLKPRGRYAVSGAIGGPMVQLDVRTLYLKDLSFFGCTLLESQVFPNLIGYIERGEIRPALAKSYPLQAIVDAQQEFLAKAHTGKLVLIPEP
ncbi:alcohol dehydrogenase [Motiliproteus coralliicola]|uniref:Alcohol dehydrogenase n=1 Tax=Motiliproteus coralliicola TaxID=2283196 RepID=A0A369WPL8_9GAMM|nr:alcohol dehydrogenase family protein [Motiliproteus coralliicola]RDE24038.1 alcohol dehydrogenase [Motiliproteus coralliicola]